jgi:alpha-L-fucosidase 2
MAFASGIHEMLCQSHTGTIRVFPAIPASWENVSFEKLRAVGAFLVSARLENGKVSQITVKSEKGGTLRLMKPTDEAYKEIGGKILNEADGIWIIEMKSGETLKLIPMI